MGLEKCLNSRKRKEKSSTLAKNKSPGQCGWGAGGEAALAAGDVTKF